MSSASNVLAKARYECAKELKEVVLNNNIAPLITLSIVDLFIKLDQNLIKVDGTLYDTIQQIIVDKLKKMTADSMDDEELNGKAKAYMVLLLEIISHAKLVKGLEVPLKPLKTEKFTKFSIKLEQDKFAITKKGFTFLEKVTKIVKYEPEGAFLFRKLTSATSALLKQIVARYEIMSEKEEILSDRDNKDFIVVDILQ